MSKLDFEKVLYPVVRVRAKNAGGSGTVIWCGKVGDIYKTFVLTNHHVVRNLIQVKEEFDPFLQRKKPKESRETAIVEFFRYRRLSRHEGTYSVAGDIVAYDEQQDVALIELRKEDVTEYVAKLPQLEKETEIFLGDPICVVGAALGHAPLVTRGHLNHMDDEIDGFKYWLTNAQVIFGNSGGASFLEDTYEFIGIPSRVAVQQIGWSVDAITHLGFIAPFPRIWRWLHEQYYHFIYDENYTYEQCERDRKIVQEQKKRMFDVDASQLSNASGNSGNSGKYYSD